MVEIVEKDLSYKIVGALMKVHTALGSGYQEKYYQKAIAIELQLQSIGYKEQLHIPLEYEKESIGKYFIDFLIEDKIVLEIKATKTLYPRDYRQVRAYLKCNDLRLGILANFGKKSLEYKRILN